MIKILFFGDVVGEAGVSLMEKRLGRIREQYGADLTVVNGENSADGNGMTKGSATRLYDCGADVVTGGNHTFRRREIHSFLDDTGWAIRPANYPSAAPGMGYTIVEAKGFRVLVMNLLGVVFMDPMTPPHECAERILKAEKGRFDVAVCDFHGEATSEKLFFARYFDTRLSVVVGTHTHVATSDVQILPGGCGYITDLGMCGSHNGILGVKSECVIHKFTVKTPVQFTPAEGNLQINGAYFEVNETTGKCVKAQRVYWSET